MAGFDASAIDEAIHGRLRLGVMAYLAAASPANFTELAKALDATNGNLSVHLKKLEDAGYISLDRGEERGRNAQTKIHLTPSGARAWAIYLEQLRPLFGD